MKAGAPGSIRDKKALLHERLKRQGRILLGFSGGKDSFFLLRQATLALGEANVSAYFVNTPFIGEAARARVAYFKKKFPFPLREIDIDLLRDARMRQNPRQRCFLCKQRMFGALKKEAKRLGIGMVADGTTVSDLQEHRPGRRALEKLGIVSPLQEAGFSGDEIIGELKKLGVDDYFLTSSTCLATRFPYEITLETGLIAAIGQVEHYLIGRGIQPLRVRYIPDGVRIETGEANMRKVLAMKKDLLAFCRSRNFRFVTLDLGGFRSGSWDDPPATAVPAH
jgi:pyridinium-3,5-biscarboxylic acid mononucleotide sulfurtransferase